MIRDAPLMLCRRPPVTITTPPCVKRCADIVGAFPNEGSMIWLIAAVLLETSDEWKFQHR